MKRRNYNITMVSGVGMFILFVAAVAAIIGLLYLQFSIIMDGLILMSGVEGTTVHIAVAFIVTIALAVISRTLFAGVGLAMGWFILNMSWWQPILIFFPIFVIVLFGGLILSILSLVFSAVVDFFERR